MREAAESGPTTLREMINATSRRVRSTSCHSCIVDALLYAKDFRTESHCPACFQGMVLSALFGGHCARHHVRPRSAQSDDAQLRASFPTTSRSTPSLQPGSPVPYHFGQRIRPSSADCSTHSSAHCTYHRATYRIL